MASLSRKHCFLRACLLILISGFSGLARAQSEPQPPLTTAEQVHRLSREEAARGHAATIRGVVTCSLPHLEALVVQDTTRGIYISRLTPNLDEVPAVGELVEIEGITDPGEFAPNVVARRLKRLGPGGLPTPIRPTWDQLINGSLDTQFVEIQAVVTAVSAEGLTLLTHGGKIKALLLDSNRGRLTQYENSLIRLRGCLFASWDAATHQVRVGLIRMFSPAVTVEEAAPEDVFAIGLKRVPELLLFDLQASALRRVRVAGQVVHEREGEHYMMDGADGLRFVLQAGTALRPGDLVEVAGFPVLTGPSPLLREAIARKTGTAPLSAPKKLDEQELFNAENDATRVTVEGMLLGLSADQQTLELQSGLRRFLARIAAPHSPVSTLPIGSRLELTGVYAGHGGSRSTGGAIDSFELLLNSPLDARILARPPFWTLRRLLVLVSILVAVLICSLVWIRLLQHKVQARTIELRQQIRERERAEHRHALEQERARIARDLHDDLGSSLTEISMLATAVPGGPIPSHETFERLETIAGKSRTMVHALDEIVWAVDPQRDTLASAARYLASYAEEYLGGLKVGCRVQLPNSFPNQAISGEVRHDLFLAVKESLNNAVRHGGATEIGFRVSVADNAMQISIIDNGSGFNLHSVGNGNGLSNLHERLERLGGQCELKTSPGMGTTVTFKLPLPINKI